MGKNNLILGTARGKLGDIVFYRTGGEQRFRTRVRPTNPRTNAQILQRAVVSTAVKFYSEYANVGNHAFQNFDGSLKNHQRFMRLNIKMLREMALSNIYSWAPIEYTNQNTGNYNVKDSTNVMINPYIVSEGDLNVNGYRFFTYGELTRMTINGGWRSEEQVKAITYADVVKMLNATAGDQITMIVCTGQKNSGIIEQTYIGRTILAPAEGNDMSALYFQDEKVNLPNKENYGDVMLGFTQVDEGRYSMAVLPNNSEWDVSDAIGFAVIRSKFENEVWKRSTSQMVVKKECQNVETLQKAMESYLKSQSSSEYLNQAEDASIPKQQNARSTETIEVQKK